MIHRVDSAMSSDGKPRCNEESVEILSLPVELLVYIISFLPIRDKVKLRNVSWRLRVVGETPSLWRQFLWPLYDRREEHSVMSVLKDCGEYIKQLVFPDHVIASTLIKMLSFCDNVTELSLPPPGTKLDPKQLGIALQSMGKLETLEVQLSSDIKPLLQIGRLRELTVHIKVSPRQQTLPHVFCMSCVQKWVTNDFVPRNLNIVTRTFVDQLRKSFLKSWKQWNSTIAINHSSRLKLFSNFRSTLNHSLVFPNLQLEFSEMATLPLVKASSFGLFVLQRDLVLLSNSVHNGKAAYKAKVVLNDFDHVLKCNLISVVIDLGFVTDFDFSFCKFLQSRHLEQLAVACPNLKRLNLGGNRECLCSLKGLSKIAQCCSNLHGLNLLCISLGEVESHIQLWDMLNDMKKLTYLALDVCLFGISIPNEMRYMDNFFSLVWQFSNLQGIEIRYSFGLCVACFECKPQLKWVWLFLSYFPSLQHCKFCTDDSDSMQDIINGCKELTHLSCQCVGQLSLSSACNSNLQQLSVLSDNTDIPDIFLETVSAHCGLVHVAISVNSVSTKGITSLIRNSPELLTMVVFTHQSICNKRGSKVNLKKFKNRIKETFPCRKLYSVGTFKIVQNNKLILHHFGDYLLNSVLSSLWT